MAIQGKGPANMQTRIEDRFEQLKARGQKAFIPYITLGDPDLETTGELILALERGGADIIELGVPFSDPLADGPVIQRAAERALSRGFTLRKALSYIKKWRTQTSVPFLLFSYFNPLFAYGFDQLVSEARECGIDGFLITDLSVEEAEGPANIIYQAGLNLIFLVAPTSTPERIEKIAHYSSGFLYAVSRVGVTGEQSSLSDSTLPLLSKIRKQTSLPVAVGFGISNPEQIRQVQEVADGAVVGSALVRFIETHSGTENLPEQVEKYTRWLLEKKS
jgi:tryptophan synthase alpha chain